MGHVRHAYKHATDSTKDVSSLYVYNVTYVYVYSNLVKAETFFVGRNEYHGVYYRLACTFTDLQNHVYVTTSS